MRPSPPALFVVAALALAGGLGAIATRTAEGAADGGPALPSDAASFGFVVQSHANGVPLLASTKPFSLPLANGPVHGVPPTGDRLARGAAIVARELGRYPSAFLRGVHLAGVVLADDLAENEMAIPSLPNVGGLLLLDVSSVEKDLVRSLHHEVFHFFDLADDGHVAPDPEWSRLNPTRFVYGSGGRTLRGAWAAHPVDDAPGFVSAYATSGVEEDKADTFAFAVARAEELRPKMKSDAVLHAKVAELARRVALLDADCARRLGLEGLLAP
ncbi:MAG: hypothetical protein KF795_14470 [Labilithrix sp.]|nr:hypothetical protein [Labilithrix sp.]